MNERPKVVVVGAGFGGLWAAKELARGPVDVLLLDRNNYHTFLPLLYQVAAAEITPEEIAYPVRSIVRKHRNVEFRMAEVTGVDLERRRVELGDESVPYDYLILAPGSTTSFFGVPGAEEHAFQLHRLEEASALRNHILSRFECAVHERDEDARRRMLTFVIVGGGATGVEFGCALAELVFRPLRRDYPTLDFREVKIALVEADAVVLNAVPRKLSAYARRRLKRLHIRALFRSRVVRVTEAEVHLQDSTIIPTETVVWTAGVRGALTDGHLPTGRGDRVRVLPTLQIDGHTETYVVGDLSLVDGEPLPQVAPVAIQQGTLAGRNILRQVRGEVPAPFRYKDPGTMVMLGRNSAVANVFGLMLTGFSAWLVWVLVHIAKLIGFRNRLIVLVNWAWDYLFFDRGVRLILPSAKGPKVVAGEAEREEPATVRTAS